MDQSVSLSLFSLFLMCSSRNQTSFDCRISRIFFFLYLLGAYEFGKFAAGTKAIMDTLVDMSIAGGEERER
jgi:hypothetical protein